MILTTILLIIIGSFLWTLYSMKRDGYFKVHKKVHAAPRRGSIVLFKKGSVHLEDKR